MIPLLWMEEYWLREILIYCLRGKILAMEDWFIKCVCKEISCLDLPLPLDCDNTIDDMGEMGLQLAPNYPIDSLVIQKLLRVSPLYIIYT